MSKISEACKRLKEVTTLEDYIKGLDEKIKTMIRDGDEIGEIQFEMQSVFNALVAFVNADNDGTIDSAVPGFWDLVETIQNNLMYIIDDEEKFKDYSGMVSEQLTRLYEKMHDTSSCSDFALAFPKCNEYIQFESDLEAIGNSLRNIYRKRNNLDGAATKGTIQSEKRSCKEALLRLNHENKFSIFAEE